jgi:hypothetical protein
MAIFTGTLAVDSVGVLLAAFGLLNPVSKCHRSYCSF